MLNVNGLFIIHEMLFIFKFLDTVNLVDNRIDKCKKEKAEVKILSGPLLHLQIKLPL